MERRRTVGGNPETIVNRLVHDVAPDVEEDEADFAHNMFAQFDQNSHIDELVDPDSERQLQLSQEPLSLIGLFSQEGSTPSPARLLALQDLCSQPGAMPSYDANDMSEALQAAGERAGAGLTISNSQHSLMDIIAEDGSCRSSLVFDGYPSSSHEVLQPPSMQLLPIRCQTNRRITGKRSFSDASSANEDSMLVVMNSNDFEALSWNDKVSARDKCVALIMNGLCFNSNSTRHQTRSSLKQLWSAWAIDIKAGWWAHICDPARNSIPVIIQAERQRLLERYGSGCKTASSQSQLGTAGVSSTVADDDMNKVHGCILTWNGRWGTNNAGIQNLVQMKLPWRAEQKAIREHPLYQWLWRHFVDWATSTAIKLQWPKYSMNMELTLNRAKPCNVVHFHMCVSDAARRHSIHQTDKSKWRYGGVEPHVCPCGAKGHRIDKSLNTIHYYCQAPKIGFCSWQPIIRSSKLSLSRALPFIHCGDCTK